LGKNAYIITSLDGSSFCVAGKRAYHILSTNSLRVFAINSVGDFVLLLGKVFVVLAAVLIGIELIQVTKKKVENLQLMFQFFNRFPEQTWPPLHNRSSCDLRHLCVSRLPLLSHRLRDDNRHNLPLLLRRLRTKRRNYSTLLHVTRPYGVCAELKAIAGC
jgi:hypothetical protein